MLYIVSCTVYFARCIYFSHVLIKFFFLAKKNRSLGERSAQITYIFLLILNINLQSINNIILRRHAIRNRFIEATYYRA
jgi:hypothetical protein